MQPPKPLRPQGSQVKVPEPQLGHETTDISLTGVIAFLVALGFCGIVIFAMLYGVFRFAHFYEEQQDRQDERSSKWVADSEQQVDQGVKKLKTPENRAEEPGSMQFTDAQSRVRITRFPQPRLQTDDVHDLALMREAEDVYLKEYFVLDKNSGKVNIPIDQAMQAVVQKGLPSMQAQPGVQLPPTAESTGIVTPSIQSSHNKHGGGVSIR